MMISYFQALAQRVQKKPCGEKAKHLQANLSPAADRDLTLAQEDLHEGEPENLKSAFPFLHYYTETTLK